MKKSRSFSSSFPFQSVMGGAFTMMGVTTMLFPRQILELSFNKRFLSDLSPTKSETLLTSCFGAQASLCGMLILSSTFTKKTYKYFGIAILPFFVFDYYFWQIEALTTFGAVGDLAGNVLFSLCCYFGYQEAKNEEDN